MSIKSHIWKHPTSAPQRKPRIGIVTGRFCRDNLTKTSMALTDTRASQLKTPAWSGALHAARRIPRAARATVQRSPPSKRVQTRELVVLVASTAVGAFRVRLRD
ncbi:hypothetical protein NW755_14966 [Fusarium falciforme]|uniref:Uncharacterized protein n=1 Tax=Fusarium falciforme TaxID=195108 RepID=A0A9W8UYL5_9HYPO|nr:hypothetical protein NW755_14966 [Fusarium falciforme]